MPEITSDRLSTILSALGEELARAQASAHLVVIGGSALLALGAGTRPTQDVDVVAVVRDGALETSQPLPEAVSAAALRVARNFALPSDWLNAGPTSLLDTASGLPPGFVSRVERRQYGPALTVDFASRIDQVFFKLYALADRRFPRDLADLKTLAPTTEELHGAARWARTHNMPGEFDDALRVALEKLGVADVGRDA